MQRNERLKYMIYQENIDSQLEIDHETQIFSAIEESYSIAGYKSYAKSFIKDFGIEI